MFTKCPECEIAFRVTAKVLQQAHGNVRCGGCSHAFNALEFLSEEMPETSAGGQANPVVDDLSETSRRLLETLDELAGPDDVRIEDTGVEWRVLDDDAADPGFIEADSNDDTAVPEPVERRYDDNSPLPEDFDDDWDGEAVSPAERRESDLSVTPEFKELQGDLALSEPEEWTDLLDEVLDVEALPDNLNIEEELAAIQEQLASSDPAPRDELPLVDADDETPVAADNDEASEESEPELHDVPDEDIVDDVDSTAHDPHDIATIDAQINELLDDDADTGLREIVADDEFSNEADAASDATSDDDDIRDVIDTEFSAEELHDATAVTEPDDDEAETGIREALSEPENGDSEDAEVSAAEEINAAEPESEVEELEESARYLDSSGEFEAQIEAAAMAFAGDDNTEEDVEGSNDEQQTAVEASEAAGREDNDDELSSETEHYVPPPTEKEMTVNMEIDQEMMALAMEDDEFSATLVGVTNPEAVVGENLEEVESIVMEGEFVHSAVEQERLAAEREARRQLDDAGQFAESYAVSHDVVRGGRRKYDPPAKALMTAIVVLSLALGAQFVHNSRKTLATTGFFKQTVAPVYRMLGKPVTPQWDVKGWQFEVTNGSVAEEDAALVVVSRIANRADEALPYPLVHVSLTDRWEDIMGTRILEPNEYLAGALDPSIPVRPGENFTAVITIDDPAADATGFKLNVCYRDGPGTVRCAIEDFRN